tara:strand:+ start:5258 stop:6103 length:846 start_codon:yes stop_codon:yes gene_type:complete
MIKSKICSEEQYKYWNKSAYYWLKYDKEINKKFYNITKILFSKIKFSNIKNVLDVGCGSGFTTKIVSDKIGTSGRVLGADLSSPMLALLNKKYYHIKNISTLQSDVQSYSFKEQSFDLVFSRFGLMFFENPYVAFANINYSLKNKGELFFVCWTDYKYNEFFSIPVKVFTSVTGIKKKRFNKCPGPFAFNSKKYIYNVLLKCNFTKIRIYTVKTDMIAENLKTDVDIFMKVGIAAKMIRENNINSVTIQKLKKTLTKYLKEKIYEKSGSYKAKFFLVNAVK